MHRNKTPSDIRSLVSERIAPEANYLLTEPAMPGDFGWFCREHTIVLSSILTAFGYDTKIVLGDITVFHPGELILSTTASSEDFHYWSSSADFPIIDISVSLTHIMPRAGFIGPILGPGPCEIFQVMEGNAKHTAMDIYDRPTIIYQPKQIGADIEIEPDAAHISACISLHILDMIAGCCVETILIPNWR